MLTDAVRAVLESGHLAHLVTLNADGSPQVAIVWVGLDGDEIVSGHLRMQQKVRNVLLAHTYLGPDVKFPPMDDPPAGYVLRITVESVGGVGPWSQDA